MAMSGILEPAEGSFWAEELFLINNATLVLLFSILTIACLLYTSPSPRDATLSRMPSSA